jgi:hypothetical protein
MMINNSTVTVGILSDSHGFLDPRIAEAVNQCDHIVHAGDIFNAHVLSQLKPKKELIAVAGNNDFSDFWKEEESAVVNALPSTVMHLNYPVVYWSWSMATVLVTIPVMNSCEQAIQQPASSSMDIPTTGSSTRRAEPWVVNPGASGKVRTHGGPSCLVLHASEDIWKIETVLFEDT